MDIHQCLETFGYGSDDSGIVLEDIEYDPAHGSHGFRRGRKAHDALEVIRANLKEGRTAAYDADQKGYFDIIPHDKLIACVRMRITESGVLELIRGGCGHRSSKSTSKPANPSRLARAMVKARRKAE